MAKNSLLLGLLATVLFLTGAGCNSAKDEAIGLPKYPAAGGPPHNIQPIGTPETPALIILPARTPIQPLANERVIAPAPPTAAQSAGAKPIKRYTTPAPKSDFVRSKNYVSTIDATIYRIQFVDCHGFPGTLTMKKGAKLMLDNRDGRGHIFKFEDKSYGLGAYEFYVVTPATVGDKFVTCDGGGAAAVKVQL